MNFLPAEVVRALIARAMLAQPALSFAMLGAVSLRPHQRIAAARLVALIEQFGGAMLAERVGLGKTYTSLAVARHFDAAITIIAPAALRTMWVDALADCALAGRVITHEALSRGTRVDPTDGFVIVDESHRARSPDTRRYAALADLCRRARVLLVTATPLQNRRADLAAQLALFLGRRAWAMLDDELAQHVVRGGATSALDLPSLSGPHRIELATVDDCVDQIVALPAPVPAADESVAGALLTYSLIHQWSSSRAALLAALDRRRARGVSLLSALESGSRPTRAELAAWTHSGDAVQLAFPELVVAGDSLDAAAGDLDALAIAVDRHNAGVEALIRRLRATLDPDDERAVALRDIRAKHPDERIIAFCHYTETVNALRRKLARDAGIAALTAHGARLASGRVSRDTVLRQFSPRTGRDRPPRQASAAERIDLLLATDLLSEGLNLQEASVVVHLDLPWNPARLDQRVGRVRRLGSRFDAVTVYVIAPPLPAENLLRIERRLREKLSIAQRTVGVAGRILPSPLGVGRAEPGLAEQSGAIDQVLRAWQYLDEHSLIDADAAQPAITAVVAPFTGFLALVRDGHGARLVADVGSGIGTESSTILAALELAAGVATRPREADALATTARLVAWSDSQRGATAIDLSLAAAARCRRTTLARVARTLERAPRHRRAQLAPLADAARAVVFTPLGEGAERILETLAKAELSDEAWLRSIATFAKLNARPAARPADRLGQMVSRIECVILFQPATL